MILKNYKLCHFLCIPYDDFVFVAKLSVLAKAMCRDQFVFTFYAEQKIANLGAAVH